MNDERAIAAVSAGDHVALKELFDQHAPCVARRLRRVLPVDAVEDVLQETFIAVWKGAGRYHGGGDVGAWIWGIARRQAALWTRKHGRPEPVWDMRESEDPAMQAVNSADLERALASLGPEGSEQRRLARLVFIQDRPLAEVAEILDIPVGTVKSRVHRVRRLLQEALGKEP
ncbi:MAG: sigma-70 family RNA polymerase sigma factor [Chloroflexia bacterium]|nr:sigma-70 family RNA polymerase sigma factor [Chloroflexia bacterium]